MMWRRLGLMLGAAGMTACSTIVPEPDGTLYPEAWEPTILEAMAAVGDDGMPRLPRLKEDWTPEWWDEPISPRITNILFPDLARLLAREYPVSFERELEAQFSLAGADEGAAMSAGETFGGIALIPPELNTRGAIIEYWCHQYDISCDHLPGLLRIQKLSNRTYILDAQPGTSSGSMNAGGQLAGLGGSGAGQLVTGQVRVQYDPYTALMNTLSPVLGEGESAEVIPDTNTVIVSARPSTQLRVEMLVNEYNERMHEVVRIQVSVFELDTTENRGFSLTPSFSLEGLDVVRGLNLGSLRGEGYEEIFFTAVNNAITQQTLDLSYVAATASESFGLALRILQAVSDAHVVFDQTLETRNNVVVETGNTRVFDVLKSIRRTTERFQTDSVQSFEVEFDSVTTGWAMSVQPTVSAGDIITVRLALARSDLIEITPYNFGPEARGNTVVVDNMSRMFNLTLRDGESRLVTTTDESTRRNSSKILSTNDNQISNRFAVLVTARVATP